MQPYPFNTHPLALFWAAVIPHRFGDVVEVLALGFKENGVFGVDFQYFTWL
jgi:hypothetical protein